MKVKVTLFIAGNVFDVYCWVRKYVDARVTVLNRFPTARIVGITAVFD